MYLGQKKIINSVDGTTPSGSAANLPVNPDQSASASANYNDLIKNYDDQINALNVKIQGAQGGLRDLEAELANAQNDRSACDFTATKWVVSALVPGSGIAFSADQNHCLDGNNKRQDKARTNIAAAREQIKSLITERDKLNESKTGATTENRKQLAADVLAETDRRKALAGQAIALGQVDPSVIAAKGQVEATTGLVENKKILYAGVVIFIVLAALAGAYMVVSKSKA